MKILRFVLVTLAALLVAGIAVFGIAWILTAPEPLPAGSRSALRLGAGPHPVGEVEREWIDPSRATAPNGDFAGAPERKFTVSLWYPEGAGGSHPLVVYNHGFVSTRRGGTYLAEHLASHGYVVVAADFPLTHFGAPGGPAYRDVLNQPADVSFLIDRVLALDGTRRPFDGQVDPQRIGVVGLSLGGITSTLVAFHPDLRDPRVAAAVSIAGVGNVFGPRFFDHAAVPFLMIAGTSDAIIDYRTNALPIPARVRNGGLITLEGGTHVGFDQIASGLMRVLGNPDVVGCRIGGVDPGDPNAAGRPKEDQFAGLFGTPEQGLLEGAAYLPVCSRKYDSFLRAGRQQMLTTVAVHAFFESQFAATPSRRGEHAAFLTQELPSELGEVTWTPGRR